MKLHREIQSSTRTVREARVLPHRTVMLSAVALAASLAGCANAPVDRPAALRVESVLRVDHGVAGGHYEGILALARRYAGEARWALAATSFRQAVAIDARDAQVMNELGHVEAMLQRPISAIAAFERAVALAPERADLLNNLGYALILGRQPERAAAVLSATLRRDPDHAAARANLARAEHDMAEDRGAIALAMSADVGLMPALPQTAADWPPVAFDRIPPANLQWVPTGRQVLQLQWDLAEPAVVVRRTQVSARSDTAENPPPLQLRLEVSNGAGRAGLARATAAILRSAGVPTQRITNHTNFKVTQTEIQYRAAEDAAAARQLARKMGVSVALVQNPGLHANINLRLVLGSDVATLPARG